MSSISGPVMMTTYISMLRGVNAGGQKRIGMEKLKELYGSLGLRKVRTYIQSGNVVFESPARDGPKLIDEIERLIRDAFGYDVPVLLRTMEEFRQLAANSPFKDKDPRKVYVTFLSGRPDRPPVTGIERARDESEEFLLSGREIYLFCPKGYGRSKLTNNYFERKLRVSATTRNWRTVCKLLEMAETC